MRVFFFELFQVGNKYYVVGGLVFLIFYILLRRKIGWKKIQPKFPARKDYWREIGWSTLSIVLFTMPPLIILHSDSIRPHSTFYRDISAHGWIYFFAAFPLMLVIHDTYFYWMHRLIHHPRLFKRIHLVHHRSTNPSPWAAYAFHPIEAVLESMVFVIFLFTIPLHFWHLFAFFLISLVYNVYGHLGFELYPAGFHKTRVGKWVNTSVSHNMHHHYFKGNYGLYFLFWDRVMGTLRKDYDTAYQEVTTRKNVHDAEIPSIDPIPVDRTRWRPGKGGRRGRHLADPW
jgi:sterol desaturase/sphingolipid hydroxylase (fatty acid hydroxylase superfamily)